MKSTYEPPRINNVGRLADVTQASLIGSHADNSLITIGIDLNGQPIDIPGTDLGSGA